MSITILAPAAPGHTGPGYGIFLQLGVHGPLADDLVQVIANDTGTGAALTLGDGHPVVAGPIADVTLWPQVSTIGSVGYPITYTAPGAAITLNFTWYRASFAVVETLASPGWLWDPTGGLYRLFGASGSGDSAAILAAVRRTYA